MTKEQLPLLQRSAQLCTHYNNLCAEIQQLKKDIGNEQSKIVDNPTHAASKAAEAYIKEKSPYKSSYILISILAALVPYALLGGLSELTRSGFLSFLTFVATVGVFILVYNKLNKKYKAQVYAQYRAKCISEYELQNQEAQATLTRLQTQLSPLQKEYNQLLHTMQNQAQCCVPPQYWGVGAYLCQMVETGQVNTLDQAIAQYERQQQHAKQIADMQKAAADAARWNELVGMMNSDLAAELDKKRADQTRDAIEDMVMIELMDKI